MHKLYDLKEKLLDELEMYSGKGNLSKDDVETIKYLSSAVDHICNIVEDMDGDYSGRGSYARRRDARGRYSSEGYSRAEDDFMHEMRSLMASAPNDRVRQKMQSIMSDM